MSGQLVEPTIRMPNVPQKITSQGFVDGGAEPRSDQGGLPIYLRKESLSTQEYFTLQGWDLRGAEYMQREHPPRPPRPGRCYPG